MTQQPTQPVQPTHGLTAFRPSWSFFVLTLLVSALTLFGVGVALINSSLLKVQEISVSGTSVVSPASVAQLTGLKGNSMLMIDLDAAQQQVESLTMVETASISRNWPNSVEVVIMEREPWGRWLANGIVWSIDAEGVVLEGIAPAGTGPLVKQTSALPAIRPGERVDTTAVELVAALDQRGAPLSLPSVAAYEWTLADGLVVVTDHGRIVFGDGEGLDFKYAVWDELEHEAQRRGEPLLFADLRFGLRPRVDIGINVGRAIRGQVTSTNDSLE